MYTCKCIYIYIYIYTYLCIYVFIYITWHDYSYTNLLRSGVPISFRATFGRCVAPCSAAASCTPRDTAYSILLKDRLKHKLNMFCRKAPYLVMLHVAFCTPNDTAYSILSAMLRTRVCHTASCTPIDILHDIFHESMYNSMPYTSRTRVTNPYMTVCRTNNSTWLFWNVK